MKLLDLPDDVLYLICRFLGFDDIRQKPTVETPRSWLRWSLRKFCTTCRRARHIGAALLYRRLSIYNTWCSSDTKESQFVEFLEDCKPLRQYLRHVWIPHEGHSSRKSPTITELLPQLSNLISLRCTIYFTDPPRLRSIERALRKSHLPRLQCLHISDGMISLIPHFRGIHALRMDLSYDDVATEGSARRACIPWLHEPSYQETWNGIRVLDLRGKVIWGPSVLQNINHHMPALESLGTVAALPQEFGMHYHLNSGGWFEMYIPALAKFLHLTTLSTPQMSHLGLRDFGAPGCEQCEWRQVDMHPCEKHEEKKLNSLVSDLFRECRKLKTVWMDESGVFTCQQRSEDRVTVDHTICHQTVRHVNTLWESQLGCISVHSGKIRIDGDAFRDEDYQVAAAASPFEAYRDFLTFMSPGEAMRSLETYPVLRAGDRRSWLTTVSGPLPPERSATARKIRKTLSYDVQVKHLY